jgi:hypothetical protein
MQRRYILASAGAYRGALRQIGSDGRPIESRGFARRSELRVSALLHSYGVLEGLACTVHDTSDSGARLQVDDARYLHRTIVHIPSRVRLQFLPWEQEVDCRIVWRDGRHLGVAYLGSIRSIKGG